MRPTTPAERDRARRRVRTITTTAAGLAGALTIAGAAAAAGTFAGRSVAASATPPNAAQVPTDGGLQQPSAPPSDGTVPAPGPGAGFGGGGGGGAITSGGS